MPVSSPLKYARRVQRQSNAPQIQTVVLTKSGAQTAVAGGALRFVMPEAGIYLGTKAALGTVNTGAAFLVDVNKNGVTLYTTQASRPSIAISASPAVSTEAARADIVSLAAGDLITFDIDQIGSTVAGSDLSLAFSYLV